MHKQLHVQKIVVATGSASITTQLIRLLAFAQTLSSLLMTVVHVSHATLQQKKKKKYTIECLSSIELSSISQH